MLIFYTYDNNNLVCKDTILYLAHYFSYLSSCIDKQGVKKTFPSYGAVRFFHESLVSTVKIIFGLLR